MSEADSACPPQTVASPHVPARQPRFTASPPHYCRGLKSRATAAARARHHSRGSPPSCVCPSAADAGHLPHPRLRRLDVAGEDPSPCAASSPRRPRAGVMRACQRLPSTSVQSQRRTACVAQGRTSRVREPRTLVVAWAAFQRRSHARGPRPTWPWAARLGGPGPANAVRAERELGCRWSFGPLAFDLFLYFLIIFKSLQIQKFV
jgi:hypothetical protein